MAKPYDASAKFLIENFLPDWLALSSYQTSSKVEVIDADLSTVSAAADKVLKIHDELPWLTHVELQASRDDELPSRVAWYNGLLEYSHGLPVHSMVVLLRREADSPALTGRRNWQLPGEAPYKTFQYQVVRVWELSLARLLTGGPGLLPLAPLTDEAAKSLPIVIQAMSEQIQRHVAPNRWPALDGSRRADGFTL